MEPDRDLLRNLVAYERYEEVFSITYFSSPMDLHSAHLVMQSKFKHDPDVRLALSNAYNILVHENPPEKAARIYRTYGTEKAIQYLNKVISDHCSPELLSTLGAILVRNHQFTDGIHILEKVRDLHGREAHFCLGVAYFKTGRYEDAVDSLRKALIQPDPAIFAYIGRSLYWLNNFSSALRYLKKAVELRGSGTDYFWKGCTLSKMKKYEDAKACFEKSADMRGNASDYHWLGTTLSAMGRTTEAVTPLEKAVELRGDAIDYRKLGIIYAKSGDYQKARSNLSKAASMSGLPADEEWLSFVEKKLANSPVT